MRMQTFTASEAEASRLELGELPMVYLARQNDRNDTAYALMRMEDHRAWTAWLGIARHILDVARAVGPPSMAEIADSVREDEEPALCSCGKGYVGHANH